MNRVEGTVCQPLDDDVSSIKDLVRRAVSELSSCRTHRLVWVCGWDVRALEGREERRPLQAGGGGRGLLYRYRSVCAMTTITDCAMTAMRWDV